MAVVTKREIEQAFREAFATEGIPDRSRWVAERLGVSPRWLYVMIGRLGLVERINAMRDAAKSRGQHARRRDAGKKHAKRRVNSTCSWCGKTGHNARGCEKRSGG